MSSYSKTSQYPFIPITGFLNGMPNKSDDYFYLVMTKAKEQLIQSTMLLILKQNSRKCPCCPI